MTDFVTRRLTDMVTVHCSEHFGAMSPPQEHARREAWEAFAADPATRSLDVRDHRAVARLVGRGTPRERARIAAIIEWTAGAAYYPNAKGFHDRATTDALRATRQVCALGALTPGALRSPVSPLSGAPFVVAEAVELWRARAARERASWTRALRQRWFDQANTWLILRQLEREAGAETPHDAEYLRMAWDALDPYGHLRFAPSREAAVADYLVGDPDLAAELAGALRISSVADYLASFAKRDILERILELSRTGVMPRATLLDAAIDCLAQDNKPGTSAALRRVVSGLNPSAQEFVGVAPRILAIVSHAHPAEQAEGATWLAAAVRAGATVDTEHAAGALAAALEASTATGARKLLKAAEKILPPATGRAVLRAGLSHASDDVAVACAQGLAPPESLADADTAALLAALEDASPRLRAAIRPLLGPIGGLSTPRHGRRLTLMNAARSLPCGEARALDALPHAHAVVDHVLSFLAGSASGLDVELILDGLSRHSASAITPSERAILSKAITRNRGPSEWSDFHRSPAVLDSLTAWTEGRHATRARTFGARRGSRMDAVGLEGGRLLLMERFREAAAIGTAGPRPSLCLPTTTDGSISRVRSSLDVAPGSAPAMPAELALARLRSPADDDAITLLSVAFSPNPSPWGPQPPRRTIRVDVQPAAKRLAPLAALAAGLDPATDRDGRFLDWAWPEWGPVVPEWGVITFPRHLDVLAAVASTSLHLSGSDDNRGRSEHAVIEALGRTPMGLGGSLLLLSALWSGIASARAVATDVFRALATVGELPTGQLGSTAGALATADASGLSRFAETLRDVARDQGTAPAVCELVTALVTAAPPDHRHLGAVLEAWEIAVQTCGTPVEDPAARASLRASATGTSKRAQSARRLLGEAS